MGGVGLYQKCKKKAMVVITGFSSKVLVPSAFGEKIEGKNYN
jgi:hypothetical protein